MGISKGIRGGGDVNIEAAQTENRIYILNFCISCIFTVTKAVNLDFQRHRGKGGRERKLKREPLKVAAMS